MSSSMNKTLQLHAIFRGNVQGVGFRWTVVDHAEKFHLNGTVQNLENGNVEVYAEGSQEALDAFVHLVKENPGLARIKEVSLKFTPSNTPCSEGFRIL